MSSSSFEPLLQPRARRLTRPAVRTDDRIRICLVYLLRERLIEYVSVRRRVRAGRELRRTLAVQYGSRDREVGQLVSVASGAQQQPAATHIAAADERGRKQQALPEDVEQSVDI